jgi:hypothetical protein
MSVCILFLPLCGNFVCRSGFRDASLHLLYECPCRWYAGLWRNVDRQSGAVPIVEHEWGHLVESCSALLMANSIAGSLSSQSSCVASTLFLSMSSKTLFTLSVCLSVCGWYAVDKVCFVPSDWHSALVNALINCGPLSETVFWGTPWSFHTFS